VRLRVMAPPASVLANAAVIMVSRVNDHFREIIRAFRNLWLLIQ
jgi:hypothetical protein